MPNTPNVEEKFIQQLEEILERDNGSIKMDDIFRDYPEWDSLNMLAVIAMINEEFDVTIPRLKFDNLLSVRQLYEFIIKQE